MNSRRNIAPSNINPANAVTLLRMLLVVPIVYYTVQRSMHVVLWYLGAFVLLDIVDGILARKLNCQTIFGKNFDVVADLVVFGALFLTLFSIGRISWLFFMITMIPALPLQIAASFIGMQKMHNTIIGSRYKAFRGGSFVAILVCFLLDVSISSIAAWIFLGVYFVLTVQWLIAVIRTPVKHSKDF